MANKHFNHEAESGPMIVQASTSLKAHELFVNKTLAQVGKEFDLADEDVQFAYTTLKDKSEARHLSIMIDGTEYIIPFSRSCGASDVNNFISLQKLLKDNWLFRGGFMSFKDDGGEQLRDPETDEIMLDKTKPYMSIGLPGLNITRREDGWGEPDDNDLGADTTVGAKPAVTGKVKAPELTQKERIAAAKAAKAAKIGA